MTKKPVLSIGMIFKNEIRCLERCMKSLQPLRDAIPCELVMADTGSNDGSRTIAERYADVLLDFPWADDFSAARNAVMDRCSGEWHLQIDADEWLDEDISELTDFLKDGTRELEKRFGVTLKGATLPIRNYTNTGYTDSPFPRLLRLSLGIRYTGRIHESAPMGKYPGKVCELRRTLLHHDGYVGLFDTEAGRKKLQRNLKLLRAELRSNPEDLNRLMQYIESAQNEPDVWEVCQRACALVEEKRTNWQAVGPSIFRHAVFFARRKKLPELEKYIARAEEWFPNSAFTKLDVGYTAFTYSREKGSHAEAVRRGEQWLKDAIQFRDGGGDQAAAEISTLSAAEARYIPDVQLLLADSCLWEGMVDRAWELLEHIDVLALNENQARFFTVLLLRIQSETERDTAPVLLRFWEQLSTPTPAERRAKERRRIFEEAGRSAFSKEEMSKADTARLAYTLFLPLAGQCDVGTAAAILTAESTPEMERLLGQVLDWTAFPPLALAKALLSGAAFPPPGKPLKLEEMDALAAGLSQDLNALYNILDRAEAGNWQTLAWARALALAGVQACDWTDEARGMELCRTFVKVEREFLPQYYNPELLCAENIHVLPPLHRFGWYCGLAFEALDGGDAAGYVRLLREGLAACEGMKPMVEFLTDHTPQLQSPKPSGELLALAEQVRTLLAQYPADDPAVAALKQSPAYQKVAHLIEGPDLGVLGGLKQ